MVRFAGSALACCLVALVGCNKSNYSVTGFVKYKDGRDVKPLAGGMVTFEKMDELKPLSSHGTIRDDGSFTIGADDDGVPPGMYIVLVTPRSLVPRKPKVLPKGWPPLNEKYGRADKTPFKFEVQKKDNVFNLEVD
jgi:hypothetical protein